MYLEIILIGMLVGLEIPLLTRIIEENAGNLRITLSSIFSFDYIGGWQDPLRFRCSCCLSWDIFPLPFWWAV